MLFLAKDCDDIVNFDLILLSLVQHSKEDVGRNSVKSKRFGWSVVTDDVDFRRSCDEWLVLLPLQTPS